MTLLSMQDGGCILTKTVFKYCISNDVNLAETEYSQHELEISNDAMSIVEIVDMQRAFHQFFIISLCNVNASIYEGYFKAGSIRYTESEIIFLTDKEEISLIYL